MENQRTNAEEVGSPGRKSLQAQLCGWFLTVLGGVCLFILFLDLLFCYAWSVRAWSRLLSIFCLLCSHLYFPHISSIFSAVSQQLIGFHVVSEQMAQDWFALLLAFVHLLCSFPLAFAVSGNVGFSARMQPVCLAGSTAPSDSHLGLEQTSLCAHATRTEQETAVPSWQYRNQQECPALTHMYQILRGGGKNEEEDALGLLQKPGGQELQFLVIFQHFKQPFISQDSNNGRNLFWLGKPEATHSHDCRIWSGHTSTFKNLLFPEYTGVCNCEN